MIKKSLKTGGVIVVAGLITTLGIQASDFMVGVEGRLSGLVSESGGPCAAHEVLTRFGTHALCVDRYEASAHDDCPFPDPQSELETVRNLSSSCVPQSLPGVAPWRFVSYTQAQQLCGRTGKRLPTAEEWYQLAVGITESDRCVLGNRSGRPSPTGSADCASPAGVHDLVGNVWEWVYDTTNTGVFAERALPASGYVAAVDGAGVVVDTTDAPQTEFGDDYAWTAAEGVRGFLRGGFYGSGSDGGIFSQNLSVSLDFATAGVGFRCVRDVL